MKPIKQSSCGNQVKEPRRKRIASFGILPLVLFAIAFIQGCGLKGGSKPDNAELTAESQLTETKILQHVQETLNALATETASVIPPSATSHAPSPFPTFTETAPPPSTTITNTPITPTDAPPSETVIPPTSTLLSYFYQANFRRGGTSAFYQKTIHAWEQHHYTVWAMEGQTLILNASSANNDVTLAVRGLEDGQQLLWPGAQARYWSGRLPRTQNYLVTISTSNPETTYFLGIEVPVNIFFDLGAYSDTIEGYIDVDASFHPNVLTRVRYLARASEGQKMTVKLNSPNINALSLGIVGQADGKVYLNYDVKNREGEVKLPSTQGYYIDVYSVNGKSTSFTLKVTIR